MPVIFIFFYRCEEVILRGIVIIQLRRWTEAIEVDQFMSSNGEQPGRKTSIFVISAGNQTLQSFSETWDVISLPHEHSPDAPVS